MKNVIKLFSVFAFVATSFCAKSQVEVLPDGNVGVGTSNPTYTLDVLGNNGSAGNRNFRVRFKNGGSLTNTEFSALTHTTLAGGNNWTALYAKKGSASKAGVFDGNVTITDSLGIGRTNPAFRLDVYGDGRFGDNSNNVIIGTGTYKCFRWMNQTAPAVYSLGKLLLGTPNNWAFATFSEIICYNDLWKYSKPTSDIDLCNRDFLDDVLRVSPYVTTPSFSKDSVIEQIEYVFNPVELQAAFPELVSVHDTCDGGEPQYAINYVGMVPILTAAVNEQQAIITTQKDAISQLQMENEQQQEEIDMLQQIAWGQELDLTELYELRDLVYVLQDIVSQCCGIDITFMRQQRDSINNNNRNNNIPLDAVLYQSKPSPFSTNTDISCYVPVIADSAFVYVYNLQGIQVKSFPIIQGQNIVTISASELPAGMYLYTLVVDDVIIDSKRLILTK